MNSISRMPPGPSLRLSARSLRATSASISDEDRENAEQMNDCCEQISQLLRAKLDDAYTRLADPGDDAPL